MSLIRRCVSLALAFAVVTFGDHAFASRDGEGRRTSTRPLPRHAPRRPHLAPHRPRRRAHRPRAHRATRPARARLSPTRADRSQRPGQTAEPMGLSIYGYLRRGPTTSPPKTGATTSSDATTASSRQRTPRCTRAEPRLRPHVRISIEGASDELSAPNTPIGSLSVRLRDAFARWDPFPFAGIQGRAIQSAVPRRRAAERSRSSSPTRAVGVEASHRDAAFQLPGIQLDRQLGVMPVSDSSRSAATSASPTTSW